MGILYNSFLTVTVYANNRCSLRQNIYTHTHTHTNTHSQLMIFRNLTSHLFTGGFYLFILFALFRSNRIYSQFVFILGKCSRATTTILCFPCSLMRIRLMLQINYSYLEIVSSLFIQLEYLDHRFHFMNIFFLSILDFVLLIQQIGFCRFWFLIIETCLSQDHLRVSSRLDS